MRFPQARAILAAFVFSSAAVFAQEAVPSTDDLTLRAQEEFRLGVQAYDRFGFNEAIVSFERALSFRPGEALLFDWLGRAYYRSGLDGAALSQWQAASSLYDRFSPEALVVGSKIETISNRRSLLPVADDDILYVQAGLYPGTWEGKELYRQPTSVLPLDDGSVWVVAYGSNEIIRIDVNGIIRARQRGPLNGFDRPYDIAKGPDGRLFVSEFRGGRVSVLNSRGEWQSYIGEKGRGDGQLIGAQNIAVDGDGYVYVVDYGNRRVSKFDPEGVYITSMGRETAYFPGFKSPTGIACKDGRVFVADGVEKCIHIFDSDGAYQGLLVGMEDGLAGPESLRLLSDGRLLVVDTNRLLLIDTDSALIRRLGMVGGAATRITGADMDQNGNILAADFAGGQVNVLTRMDDMASGLFVQIDRVYAEKFPDVVVDLRVQDRLRRPIAGLDAVNFILSENGTAAAEQNFYTPADRLADSGVAILVERSPRTSPMKADLAAAVRDISTNMSAGGKVLSLVSAGVQPERERIDLSLDDAARGRAGTYDARWRFDLGLRLAATDLLGGPGKRAVFFLSSGAMGELAFEQYSLSQLAAYMANNGIVFNAVIIGPAAIPDELRYLCAETGGQALPLYRPEGIRAMVRKNQVTGAYTLSYRSRLDAGFGRAYLPVEAEVYLMERSGRDKTGYFAPLE